MRWWALRTRAIALLLCAASFGVFATPVERASNSIGQDLGVWQGSEYRLVLFEGKRTLYKGDRVQFIEEERIEGGRTIVRRWDEAGALTLTIIEAGHPIEQRSGDMSVLYRYDEDGYLTQLITLVDGRVNRVESFSYRDGELSVVTALGDDEALRSFSWRTGDRLFTYNTRGSGQSFALTASGRQVIEGWSEGSEPVREIIRATEEGGYTITRATEVEVYDSASLLIQTIDPVAVTNYRYNEDHTLVASERTSGGQETITYYEEGRVVGAEQRVDGELKKTIRYGDDGSRIETLYVDGRPYSDVTYEGASNRVRSIVYH